MNISNSGITLLKKNRRAKWKRDRKRKSWSKHETTTETATADPQCFQTSMFFPDVTFFEENHESLNFQIGETQCSSELHIFRKSSSFTNKHETHNKVVI